MKPRLRHLALTFAAVMAVSFILSHGCSLEEPENRKIRGHTEDFEGVAHGARANLGARYCQKCHGPELAGGDSGEPSCYACHGLNWENIDASVSRAPADHTVENDGFRHHPSLSSPDSVCTNCHGTELQGDADQNTPSCYLCHEQVWD